MAFANHTLSKLGGPATRPQTPVWFLPCAPGPRKHGFCLMKSRERLCAVSDWVEGPDEDCCPLPAPVVVLNLSSSSSLPLSRSWPALHIQRGGLSSSRPLLHLHRGGLIETLIQSYTSVCVYECLSFNLPRPLSPLFLSFSLSLSVFIPLSLLRLRCWLWLAAVRRQRR